MNRRGFLSSAAGAITATKGLLASSRPGRRNQKRREEILKTVRVIQVDDMGTIAYMTSSPSKRDIEEEVAKYAGNDVDV